MINFTFNHIALSVRDVDESVAFYQKVFHFKEIDECQGFVLFVSRSCSILCNGKTGTKEKQNHQKVWGVN